MEMVPGQRKTIADILQYHLPPESRPEFLEWAGGVSDEQFREGLNAFFTLGEIQSALLEYLTERLAELELFTGVRIDAILNVVGQEYNYRSYNETAGI